MSWLQALAETGRIADLLAAIVAAEMAILLAWKRAAAIPVVIGLLPGLALMLALGAALRGAEWWVAIGWVTLALPLHLLDLRQRLR